MASRTSPAPCRHPDGTGLFPGLPEKGGLELGPAGIRVLCQEEVISLQPSAQAEALRPDSCVQAEALERREGWEGLRRGQREGGERAVRSLVSHRSGALASCLRQEETRDKRVPAAAAGSGPLAASWPLSTPSGQDVSLSEEESPPVAGRGTPSRARN